MNKIFLNNLPFYFPIPSMFSLSYVIIERFDASLILIKFYTFKNL